VNGKHPESLESAKMRESMLNSVLELLKQGIVHSSKWFVVLLLLVMESESNELSVLIIKNLTSAICTLLRDRDCILAVSCPSKYPTKLTSISPRPPESLEETNVKEMPESIKQNGLLLSVVDTLLDYSDTGVVQGAIGIVGTIAEMFSPIKDADQDSTLRVPPLPIVYIPFPFKELNVLGFCIVEPLLE